MQFPIALTQACAVLSWYVAEGQRWQHVNPSEVHVHHMLHVRHTGTARFKGVHQAAGRWSCWTCKQHGMWAATAIAICSLRIRDRSMQCTA